MKRNEIGLMNKILAITKNEDYQDNPEKLAKVNEYEHQTCCLVRKSI